MAKNQSKFVCQQCGYESTGWLGKCPNCGSWNSLVETVTVKSNSKQVRRRPGGEGSKPVRLGDVEKKKFERVSTGVGELDRALGGGLVPGQVILVAGEPGIGKSTLLLQACNRLCLAKTGEEGLKVLYVSGEESAEQVAMRAERLGVTVKVNSKQGNDIYLLAETDVDAVVDQMNQVEKIALVVVDSIQTMTTEDLAGVAGSVGQVRECASRIIQAAKVLGVPVFLVGHVTKEGTIAGPRVLEHLVDTVLWFEGSRSGSLRVVRAVKNRFGPTDEAGVFEMRETGLSGVDNPSALFLSERDSRGVAGSVVTCLLEGTRPMLVEIQALVVPSQLAIPRRVASGVDYSRLQVIVAVLTRRMGMALGGQDIFVNVAGGIQVAEPSADLAIAMAIISAFEDRQVDPTTVVLGEVGLLGEIRQVGQFERRIKEAKRLGFNKVVGPEVKTLKEAARTVGRS